MLIVSVTTYHYHQSYSQYIISPVCSWTAPEADATQQLLCAQKAVLEFLPSCQRPCLQCRVDTLLRPGGVSVLALAELAPSPAWPLRAGWQWEGTTAHCRMSCCSAVSANTQCRCLSAPFSCRQTSSRCSKHQTLATWNPHTQTGSPVARHHGRWRCLRGGWRQWESPLLAGREERWVCAGGPSEVRTCLCTQQSVHVRRTASPQLESNGSRIQALWLLGTLSDIRSIWRSRNQWWWSSPPEVREGRWPQLVELQRSQGWYGGSWWRKPGGLVWGICHDERRRQALTTPRKIRLSIRQPAAKNQVAPVKDQVAPFCPALL